MTARPRRSKRSQNHSLAVQQDIHKDPINLSIERLIRLFLTKIQLYSHNDFGIGIVTMTYGGTNRQDEYKGCYILCGCNLITS